MNDLLQTARLLKSQGIACIPCREDKTPNLSTWSPYREVLPTDEQLEKWFNNPETTSIAIVAGQVQCLDIDTKNHEKGTHFFKEDFLKSVQESGLQDLIGNCVIQQTPSGGFHIIWKCTPKDRNQIIAKVKIRKKLKPIIETRGEGGYFLIYPSPGYKILSSSIFEIPEISESDRESIYQAARNSVQNDGMEGDKLQHCSVSNGSESAGQNGEKMGAGQRSTERKNSAPSNPEKYFEKSNLETGEKPGEAYNQNSDLPALLRKHGWTQLGNSKHWRRPGKNEGVSATWDAMEHCPGRLWVFSTSTEFEPEKAYTPFQCYAILEHGSDFKQAAKVLYQQGYGSRAKPSQAQKQDSSEPRSGSSSEPSRFPPILSWGEEEDEEWLTPPELIKGMLYRGAKGMVAGPSKSRKTFVLTDLAVSVASGLPWLGFDTISCPVIYINLELQNFAYRSRRRQIQKAKNHVQDIPLFSWHLRGYAMTLEAIQEQLIRVCKLEGIGLIVLDPIYKIGDAGDENNAKEVGRLLNEFERLGKECNASTVFAHHYAKGTASDKSAIDRASGSGVWARDPDCMLFFSPHEEEDCMIVETSLRNFEGCSPFCVRWTYPTWEIDTSLDPADHKGVKKKGAESGSMFSGPALKKVLDDLNYFQVRSNNVQEIAELAGVSQRTVWRAWNTIKGKGKNVSK